MRNKAACFAFGYIQKAKHAEFTTEALKLPGTSDANAADDLSSLTAVEVADANGFAITVAADGYDASKGSGSLRSPNASAITLSDLNADLRFGHIRSGGGCGVRFRYKECQRSKH